MSESPYISLVFRKPLLPYEEFMAADSPVENSYTKLTLDTTAPYSLYMAIKDKCALSSWPTLGQWKARSPKLCPPDKDFDAKLRHHLVDVLGTYRGLNLGEGSYTFVLSNEDHPLPALSTPSHVFHIQHRGYVPARHGFIYGIRAEAGEERISLEHTPMSHLPFSGEKLVQHARELTNFGLPFSLYT